VTEVKLNEAYNFYHDSLSQEAKVFYQPMKILLDRVMALVEEWPSPILNDLAFMANYMLTQFTQDTPLMKILTGMEILLGKIDEWEAYASKNLNSLTNEELTIKQLIIRFRKIQILSWRNLLAYKRKAAIKRDVENVVRLMYIFERQVFDDNVYRQSSFGSQLAEPEELFGMLDLFLRDSSLGSYDARLKAVQLLSDAIEAKMAATPDGPLRERKLQRAEVVQNCITFIIGYYSQFKERLRKTTERLDAAAREKIKNLIDISKWSVAKFAQVKSNIDKTHRQLNTAIKQEEQVLTQNVALLVLNSSRKKYVGGAGGDEMRGLDPEVTNFSEQADRP
jgi:midasin